MDKSLRYVVSAVDRSTGKTLGDIGAKAESTSKRVGSAFSRLGSAVGGELGELLDKTGEGFDKLSEHGSSMSEKLAITGGVAAGVGTALTLMGAKEKQASDQLANAIDKTGHSAEEFEGQIEHVVGQMENYGHSAVNTKQSLQILTNATHDPQRAIALMGETANLAADKHITLESAASQVARILAGKGTRTMAAYNIELVKNTDGTTNWAATNDKLAAQLNGAASASVDNISGKIKALTTHIEDNVAEFGQKWGPTITAVGAGALVLSPILKGLGSGLSWVKGKFGEAGAAATLSAGEIGASVTAEQAYSLQVQAWSAQEAAAVSRAKADEAAAASAAAEATAVATAETNSVLAEGAASSAAAAAEFAAAQESEAAAAEASAAQITAAAAEASAAVEEEAAASSGMLGPVGAGIAVVASLGYAFTHMGENVKIAGDFTENYTESVKESTDAMNAANLAATNKTLAETGVYAQLKNLQSANIGLGISYKDLTNGVNGSDAQFARLKDRIHGGGMATDIFRAALDKARDSLTGQIEKQKEFNKGEGEIKPKVDAATAALDAQATTYGTTTSAIKEAQQAVDKQKVSNAANTLQMQLENDAAGLLGAAFDKLNGKTLGVLDSEIAEKNAIAALTQARKDNGVSLDIDTAKGRANLGVVHDAISAAQAHAEAVGKQTGSTEKATSAYNNDIAALRRHLVALGYDRGGVDALIRKYAQIPATKKTKIDITGDAYDRLYGIRDALERTTGHTWTVVVNEQGNVTSGKMTGGAGYNAAGTDYFSGGATHVAEREPELVERPSIGNYPRGTTITPVSRLRGGGTTVHLTVNVQALGPAAPSREMGQELAKHLEVYLGSGGRVRGVNA